MSDTTTPVPPGHDIVRLIRVGFDSLENHSPVTVDTVGLFIARDGKTAEARATEWLAEHPEQSYRGYDGETYPQRKIIRDPIL